METVGQDCVEINSLIPTLARGSCVVTGTSFDLPMILQIDVLAKAKQPDSEDVNLNELWHDNQG